MKTAEALGLRVQITGPDTKGGTDLQGIAGTVLGHNPTNHHYLVSYYDAKIRYAGSRYFPADSIEFID